MNLIRVELTRLRWRRAVLLLLAAIVALPVLVGIVTILDSPPPPKDEYAQAVAQAEADRESQPKFYDRELRNCLEDPTFYVYDPEAAADDPQAACEEAVLPQPEWYLGYGLDLSYEREDSGFAVVVIVGLIGLLVGTTFIGHDWNTGSMSNQLLFEPRRLRVWGAKALAITTVTGVVAAVGITAFWLILFQAFWRADSEIPDGLALDCLQMGWRGAGIAALAALIGFAITMLSRSTVFTLGLLLGVAVAGGLVIGLLVDDPGPVDPTVNISAVIKDGTTYYVDIPESCYEGSYEQPEPNSVCDEERDRSLEQGLGYLGVLSVLILGASAASYRRRDVP